MVQNNMNFKELGVFSITPVASLVGGLNGSRFIAERQLLNGEKGLISVLPPDYNLQKPIEVKPYILESAVVKHGYVPTEDDSITSFEEYEKYLIELNEVK